MERANHSRWRTAESVSPFEFARLRERNEELEEKVAKLENKLQQSEEEEGKKKEGQFQIASRAAHETELRAQFVEKLTVPQRDVADAAVEKKLSDLLLEKLIECRAQLEAMRDDTERANHKAQRLEWNNISLQRELDGERSRADELQKRIDELTQNLGKFDAGLQHHPSFAMKPIQQNQMRDSTPIFGIPTRHRYEAPDSLSTSSTPNEWNLCPSVESPKGSSDHSPSWTNPISDQSEIGRDESHDSLSNCSTPNERNFCGTMVGSPCKPLKSSPDQSPKRSVDSFSYDHLVKELQKWVKKKKDGSRPF